MFYLFSSHSGLKLGTFLTYTGAIRVHLLLLKFFLARKPPQRKLFNSFGKWIKTDLTFAIFAPKRRFYGYLAAFELSHLTNVAS